MSQSLVNEGRFPLETEEGKEFVYGPPTWSQSLVNEGRFPHGDDDENF